MMLISDALDRIVRCEAAVAYPQFQPRTFSTYSLNAAFFTPYENWLSLAPACRSLRPSITTEVTLNCV
ncbi:MAG: hypothetical protein J4G05_09600 [Chlorobi bacterium]|nr:hypothetical protein [Chlorobiota bacterium]